MLKSMTETNDNESKQLAFPIQRTPPNPNKSDDQLFTDVTLKYTQYLNEVALGTRELTEELKQDIRELNVIFSRSGYQMIDVDFN
jgi:hypothetical protein